MINTAMYEVVIQKVKTPILSRQLWFVNQKNYFDLEIGIARVKTYILILQDRKQRQLSESLVLCKNNKGGREQWRNYFNND